MGDGGPSKNDGNREKGIDLKSVGSITSFSSPNNL